MPIDSRYRVIVAALSLFCFFPTLSAFAQEDTSEIKSIEIEGNEKTAAQVINQELVIREGDAFDPEKMELSRQNIMDLGLFRSVEVDRRETPEGVEITFQVDEKRFWYLVPVFSRGSDGDVTWGVRLQMDNLFGRNNELTIRAKKTDLQDTDIQEEKTLEFEYYYPRLFGSAYDLRLNYDYDEADIEERRENLSGDYLREKETFGASVSKWLSEEGPSKGLRLTLGFRSDRYDHEFLRGDPNLFSDLTVNSLVTGLEYIDVVDHGTHRSGAHYGIEIEMASSLLGSDDTLTSQNLFMRRYMPVDTKRHHNLNLQLKIGTISDSLFGDATYQITGGTAVRGYQRDSIEGNSYYLANLEYLRPVRGRENLRSAYFLDVGDAFRKLGDFSLRNPKVGIGAGLRWKIRSFVRTDIRIDIAHGLGSDGETKVYAGTRATF